jgi:hypothetical protein
MDTFGHLYGHLFRCPVNALVGPDPTLFFGGNLYDSIFCIIS